MGATLTNSVKPGQVYTVNLGVGAPGGPPVTTALSTPGSIASLHMGSAAFASTVPVSNGIGGTKFCDLLRNSFVPGLGLIVTYPIVVAPNGSVSASSGASLVFPTGIPSLIGTSWFFEWVFVSGGPIVEIGTSAGIWVTVPC